MKNNLHLNYINNTLSNNCIGGGYLLNRAKRLSNTLSSQIFLLFVLIFIISSCEAKKDDSSASLIPKTFTLTFDSQDGTEVPQQTIKNGEKAQKPTDPTRDGYTFEGWYQEKELKNIFDFTKETITTDTTIYAKWKPTFTLVFNSKGGIEVDQQTIISGEKAKKPTDPIKNDYLFEGWYKEEDLKTIFDFTKETITADVTVYAKWKLAIVVTYPYTGANELTFSITNKLEGAVDFTFGISTSKETTLPAQLGRGYITRTLTKDVSREVFMAHINTIPDDIKTITAEHLMKENTTYYLNIYKGRTLVSQKSFTTAKFASLPTLERKQGANNMGIYSWNQYFPSNGAIKTVSGNSVSTPQTSTEIDSPKKIEVKEEEYLILPIRVAFPIFADPSPVSSSEEVNFHLIQVKANNKATFETIFTYFTGTETLGTIEGTNTVFLERKVESTNFDVYFTAIIVVLPSDPVARDYFLGDDGLLTEYNIQYNSGKYSARQTVQNVNLITK